MYILKIINEDSLFELMEIKEFSVYSGESARVAIQILSSYDNDPIMLPGYDIYVTFPVSNGEVIEKQATITDEDPSVIYVDLSIDDTLRMKSGAIKVTISSGDVNRIAYLKNAVKVLTPFV